MVNENYTILELCDEVFAIFVIITVKWLNIVHFNTIQSQVADEEERAKQIFK